MVSDTFKALYIDEKVHEMCNMINTFTKIPKSQPHIASAAYIHGEQYR